MKQMKEVLNDFMILKVNSFSAKLLTEWSLSYIFFQNVLNFLLQEWVLAIFIL